MIRSGIPTPKKHKTPIIPLGNYGGSRKKSRTDSYSTYLGTGTSRMKKLSSLPELQSK